MISTYGKVLSAIKKALQELKEEYQGVRKSLQSLVKGQERNITQLARIGAVVEQKWVLKEDPQGDGEGNENKEDRKEEGSENNFRES